MIFSQLMENYLFNDLKIEFCKIPNFGTVTMKTEEISANIPAKHQDSKIFCRNDK